LKTENIIRLLKILAKHDGHEDVFWREDKEGELHFCVNTNDVFYWATSDAEEILDEDLDDLEQAYNDSREAGKYRIGIYGSLLWVCRKLRKNGLCSLLLVPLVARTKKCLVILILPQMKRVGRNTRQQKMSRKKRVSQMDKTDDKYIWKNTVDGGEYVCSVIRHEKDLYKGYLFVVRVEDGKVLLNKEVPVSYGAIFGPDVADLYDWEEQCIGAIDGQ
jgi:hypothetical protein